MTTAIKKPTGQVAFHFLTIIPPLTHFDDCGFISSRLSQPSSQVIQGHAHGSESAGHDPLD
jgi:hypothetical protein